MIGAGTVINPLVKIATTIAVLAGVYFFIIKPTLDTTDKAIDRGFETSNAIQESVTENIEAARKQSERAQRRAQRQTQRALKQSGATEAIGNANSLIECIQAANGDVVKIQACNAGP